MLTSSFKCDVICFFETRKSWKTWKIMKIVNVEGENFQIFWTTWGISIKFSNTWLMIILKVTKKQCFTLYLPLSFSLSFLKILYLCLKCAFISILRLLPSLIVNQKNKRSWSYILFARCCRYFLFDKKP